MYRILRQWRLFKIVYSKDTQKTAIEDQKKGQYKYSELFRAKYFVERVLKLKIFKLTLPAFLRKPNYRIKVMKDYNEPDEKTKNDWENDPNNWIWGIFYYNPKDKRSYFPKKIKEFGWHVNYADPNNIIIIALVAAILLVLIRYAK